MDLGLSKKLPVALRNDFWKALMDAVQDELLLLKESMDRKKYFFTPSLADMERLKELGDLIYDLDPKLLTSIETMMLQVYGIPEFLVEDFLRAEILKTPFAVKNKALLELYKSSFNFLSFALDNKISVYQTSFSFDPFTGETVIFRDLKKNFLGDLPSYFEPYEVVDDNGTILEDSSFILGFNRPYGTFYIQDVTDNFLGQTKTSLTLDDDAGPTLDDEEKLLLDVTGLESKNPTKHISFEVVANQLFTRMGHNGNLEYLFFPAEAFSYLYSGLYYSYKKAVEVPHIGAQLTLFVDKSGLAGYLTSEQERLQCYTAINTDVLAEGVLSKGQVTYIKFGAGRQVVPTAENGAPFPLDLEIPLNMKIPYEEERFEDDKNIAVIAEYVGQSIGGILYPPFVGGPYPIYPDIPLPSPLIAPIRPKTLKMAFIDASDPDFKNAMNNMLRITDNGSGILVSDHFQGTIDYDTGNMTIVSIFNKTVKKQIEIDSTTFFYEHEESGAIVPESIQIIIKEDNDYYYVADDGMGNLVSDHPKFEDGTVVYLDTYPSITANFSEVPNSKDILLTYKYPYQAPLTEDHQLYLYEVFTENPVQVTEAGLYVRTAANPTEDQMLLYATFPAFEFAYSHFHLNLGLIFEK